MHLGTHCFMQTTISIIVTLLGKSLPMFTEIRRKISAGPIFLNRTISYIDDAFLACHDPTVLHHSSGPLFVRLRTAKSKRLEVKQ